MIDDPLIREWRTGDGGAIHSVSEAIEAALAKDRTARNRDRAVQVLSLGCIALLWPILLWCAANAVTPVVRGGYALMAAGVAVMLFAEFVYSLWDRRSQPGPSDSLTQIGANIGLLRLQSGLMRSAAAWCAPVFLGAGLVGWWIYSQRSHAVALAFWAAVGAAWLLSAIMGQRKSRDLDARRSRLEQVLDDLRS
jgi:hypothetical protein